MEKLKELIKKVCTKEVIFYGIFGILTTLVNLGVFYVLNTFTPLGENFSNNIAIITAVLFAYFTNSNMVFNSKAANAKQKWMEFFKFLLGRAATMVIESVDVPFYLLLSYSTNGQQMYYDDYCYYFEFLLANFRF
ncbi:MAG: GtrA family protein [Clostridia bacterium]